MYKRHCHGLQEAGGALQMNLRAAETTVQNAEYKCNDSPEQLPACVPGCIPDWLFSPTQYTKLATSPLFHETCGKHLHPITTEAAFGLSFDDTMRMLVMAGCSLKDENEELKFFSLNDSYIRCDGFVHLHKYPRTFWPLGIQDPSTKAVNAQSFADRAYEILEQSRPMRNGNRLHNSWLKKMGTLIAKGDVSGVKELMDAPVYNTKPTTDTVEPSTTDSADPDNSTAEWTFVIEQPPLKNSGSVRPDCR